MSRHPLPPAGPSSHASDPCQNPVATIHPLDFLGVWPTQAKTLCSAITAAIIAAGSLAALNPWASTRAESSQDTKTRAEKIELQKHEKREAREIKAREEEAAGKPKNSEEKAIISTGSAAATAPLASINPATQPSSVNFLAAHYNSARTGWNPNETLLTTTNVDANNTIVGAHNYNTSTAGFFGEIWNTTQFAGAPNIFPTPLYVDSVTLTGGVYSGDTLSVAYCATGKCDLYAVCASGAVVGSTAIPPGTILWHTSLGTANSSISTNSATVAIFGTPIIDLNATPPTMYVTCNCSSSTYATNAGVSTSAWLAFAVDITSGAVRSGWPVAINNAALQTVMRNGPAAFVDSGMNNPVRGALNLSPDGSILYVSVSDFSQVTGFMVTLSTKPTPKVASAFASVAAAPSNGSVYYAGLWSTAGPSVDSAGNVYVCTGDVGGISNQYSANLDRLVGYWGMTMLVFQPTATLALKGTYNPWNYQSMDVNDVDIASTPIVIPDLPGLYPHCVAFGSKGGYIYLVNRDTLEQDATSPSFTNQRPAAVGNSGKQFMSNADETSFVPPTINPYYTNNGLTPGGSTGPVNVFGPIAEGGNAGDAAKSRTSPSVFQGPDNNFYVVYTGQTKTSVGSSTPQPPGIARLKINTFSNSTPYLTIDGLDDGNPSGTSPSSHGNCIENAGSPIISSNGTQSPIIWMLDENMHRNGNLPGTHPYLLGLDAMTMRTLYKSAVSSKNTDTNLVGPSTLHAGGKYNEPAVVRGKVFVGTDRLQAFGVTSYVYAIGCGGNGGPGDTTTTLSPVLPSAGNNVITTTVGKTFTADNFVTGGTTANTTSAIDVTTVSNPAPQAVYQNARVGVNTSSGFTYTFPNLTPGASYSVRLHFSEINTSVTGTGKRLFNVSINGTQVLTSYDIFSSASGRNVACEEPFGAIADLNAGTITVAFSPVSGTTFPPMVNGIEINALPDSIAQEYWFDWLAQNSLLGAAASPTADATKDGVPNIWKYFTNTNPSAHGNPSTLLPKMSVVNSGGTNYLQFSVLERIDFATRGFSLVVQTSPSLNPSNWTNQSYTVVSTTPTGDGVTQTAVLQTPITPGTGSLFARVQLTLANN